MSANAAYYKEDKTMDFSAIGKRVLLFFALLVFASCSRGGGKPEAERARSAPKTAVTGTVRAEAPKKTSSNNTASKKKEMDFNGITQFHEP